ncbi:vacuolar protein sorting-associated protein 37C [Osmerus eperlanus]|uniref:vacuolar protein sorting-associated protein 37C n=1 Tax=Osmerus eperlanus TaxID=29151 RepID=UPI002E13DC55
MDKLQDLSQSELEELLDNADRVESMALESDEIQNIQLEREMALASNRSLAEQNLDVKPALEKQRERLVERYSQLESVRDAYRQHCSLRDGIVGQVSPEGLFTRLQTEGANTEAESEALADEFLDGALPLDTFLERFLALRSLAHKRRVRIEKLQDMLRQKSEDAASDAAQGAMTSSQASASQDPSTPSPWNNQTHHQPAPAPGSQPANHSSFQNATPNAGAGAALPYTPYPVSPPNPAPSAASGGPGQGPANPPAQFPPYPSPGSPFTPAAGYAARPGFGPPACPYPTQPTFPGPPGPAFRQYGPPNAGPYPSAYPYGGGYSYPTGPGLPSTQSPTGRPMYRPGYGVPQPYS